MRAVRLSGLVSAGLLLSLLAAQAQNPSPDERRRVQAAKLAGLAGFVNLECPDLRSDPARLKQTVEALGVDDAGLETGDLHLIATRYIETYRKDVAANCRKAEETFGPRGSVIPGLIVPR